MPKPSTVRGLQRRGEAFVLRSAYNLLSQVKDNRYDVVVAWGTGVASTRLMKKLVIDNERGPVMGRITPIKGGQRRRASSREVVEPFCETFLWVF